MQWSSLKRLFGLPPAREQSSLEARDLKGICNELYYQHRESSKTVQWNRQSITASHTQLMDVCGTLYTQERLSNHGYLICTELIIPQLQLHGQCDQIPEYNTALHALLGNQQVRSLMDLSCRKAMGFILKRENGQVSSSSLFRYCKFTYQKEWKADFYFCAFTLSKALLFHHVDSEEDCTNFVNDAALDATDAKKYRLLTDSSFA